jgi:hypothetical protein
MNRTAILLGGLAGVPIGLVILWASRAAGMGSTPVIWITKTLFVVVIVIAALFAAEWAFSIVTEELFSNYQLELCHSAPGHLDCRKWRGTAFNMGRR